VRNKNQRVVITGVGLVSPLGETVDGYWKSLVNGESGISEMKLVDPDGFPCKVSGEVSDFDPNNYMDLKESKRLARFSQLAVAAAGLAIKDSDIKLDDEDSGRLGIVMGNGNGGFPEMEQNARILVKRGGMRVSPFFIPMILPNMAAANVSRIFGIKGYTNTVVTACAAGTQSIGEGAEVIRRGAADVVFSGGCEAGISQLGLGGFNVIRALTRSNDLPEKASKPFDANRDGFVPAEGAAFLVLENLEHAIKRDAKILGEISGYGVSSDAYHLVQPDQAGNGAAMAMELAIDDAGIDNSSIDYINAHGTSTPQNDLTETLAIKKVFGERAYKVPVSSTKSMIGHALGGAGALEAVASVKTIQTSKIHPTINYSSPDPNCDLDYVPNVARNKSVDTVMSNSFGFGGQNACIIISRFDESTN